MLKNRLQIFLLGTLAGAILAFVVAVAAKRGDAVTAGPDCPPAAAQPTSTPASEPTARHASVVVPPPTAKAAPEATAQGAAPLDVPDPKGVDPQELVGRAKALALGQDKHAKLVRIVTSDLGDDGSIDLSAGGFIEYRFEFRYPDQAQNIVSGQIVVSVQQAGITTAQNPAAPDAPPAVEPLADPLCSLKAAWRLAVTTSGAPGSKAHAEYMRHPRTKGSVWMILAAGTPPYERSIDGLNCTLLDGGPVRKKKAADSDPY